MDIQPNPGPVNSTFNRHDLQITHSTSSLSGTISPSNSYNSTLQSSPGIKYSRSDLYRIGRQSPSASHDCFPLLKELKIFRYRSKRGGRSRRRDSSTSVNNIPAHTSEPSTSTPSIYSNYLGFCLINSRSLNNKSLYVKDYIVERKLDIFAVTETWLKSSSDSDFVIRDVCPSGYSILHIPRKDRSGGGVAVIYRTLLSVKLCESTVYNSFESMELTVRSRDQLLRIVVVYRPPSSSFRLFNDEFSSMLESLIVSPGKLLICGDFNFHVNDSNDSSGVKFMDLLDCFSLRCFDSSTSTHKNGHALDLLITRSDDDIIHNYFIHDPVISDHFAIHCLLSFVKPVSKPCTVTYRKLRSIDLNSFHQDIAGSSLSKCPAIDLSDLCEQYDSDLSTILDKHAPVRTKIASSRPKAPWYNLTIRENKTKRRRLERHWRKTKLTVDRELYVAQCNLVKDLIFSAKMSYYSKIIDDSECDNKVLFSTVDKLLHRTAETKLPSSPSSQALANTFVNFFNDKIMNIRVELSSRIVSDPDIFEEFDLPSSNCIFDSFDPVTSDDLSTMCKRLFSKSCSLDPIPANLLRDNLGLLLPVICKIVNMSLSTGYVPSCLKTAVLRSLLKKPSLNKEILANYRPISNLKMVSKVIEKAVAVQLNNYLLANSLHEPFQSGYKRNHSCETAILRVYNDILLSLDNRQCVAMLLLDLSAAFDTVDHNILLHRLRSKFGVCGSVLKWFKSYLSDRSQFVSVNGVSSDSLPLGCGVPQGSVLGPLLYILYTSPVADILRKHAMSFHMYADDTQLYIPFSCNNDLSFDDAMNRINVWLIMTLG